MEESQWKSGPPEGENQDPISIFQHQDGLPIRIDIQYCNIWGTVEFLCASKEDNYG